MRKRGPPVVLETPGTQHLKTTHWVVFGKRLQRDSFDVPAKKPEPPRIISPDMRAVGRAIKAARVEAGLTQEVLAEKSDIAPRVLQKIEAGRITILVTTLIRIRRALGCEFDDLLPR